MKIFLKGQIFPRPGKNAKKGWPFPVSVAESIALMCSHFRSAFLPGMKDTFVCRMRAGSDSLSFYNRRGLKEFLCVC